MGWVRLFRAVREATSDGSFPGVRECLMALAAAGARAWRRWRGPALVAGAGLMLSAAAFLAVRRCDEDWRRDTFAKDAADHVFIVRDEVCHTVLQVGSLVSFYAASQRVEADEFRVYVAPFMERDQGTEAFVWAPREAGIAGPGEVEGRDRFPIRFIKTRGAGGAAAGFDLASDPAIEAAMQSARDSGRITATAPVKALGGVGQKARVVVLGPVYRNGAAAEAPHERRGALDGFVGAVVRVDRFLESAIGTLGPHDLDVALYDQPGDDATARLLAWRPSPTRRGPPPTAPQAEVAPPFARTEEMDAAGRRWVAVLTAAPGHAAAQFPWRPWAAAGASLAATAGLAAYLAINARYRSQMMHLMATLDDGRRQYAALVDQAADAILSLDPTGRVVSANPAATRLSGHAAEDLVGRHFGREGLLSPASLPRAAAEFVRVLAGEERPSFELTVLKKGGGQLIGEVGARCLRRDGAVVGVQVTIRDTTERKRLEHELRRLAMIAQQAAEGIAWADLEGNLRFVNEAWARMHGYGSAEELVGRNLSMFHTDEQMKTDVVPFNEVVKQQGHNAGEVGHTRKDGTTFPTQMMVALLKDEQGKPYGLAGFAQDITDRKRAEKALAERTEELARSNEELQQFAYVASHDLQEPLRMISGYVQLLARRYTGRLDADADEFIHFAADGAARMQALINDLLEYSRVGTRGKPLAPTDAEAVLETVLADLAPAIQEAGARVTHDPLPTVRADDVQLAQLLRNLIGNGLKYRRPDTPPEVHVRAAPDGASWRFDVRDNGIGIEPQYFGRLFVLFQRLHSRQAYPGTGIGLAIAKKIVERHGGRIWLTSQPGRGSTFSFTLPQTQESRHEQRDGNRRPRETCGSVTG
jgi:PAS domain S-box-containing protein